MAIKLITSFRTLMQLAGALGEARMRGNEEEIAKAQAEHDAYRDMCLKADEMLLDTTVGGLYYGARKGGE